MVIFKNIACTQLAKNLKNAAKANGIVGHAILFEITWA